jgi:uncharacterized protein
MIRYTSTRSAFGLLLILVTLAVWAQLAVPELTRRVTDLTATLSAEQTATLERQLAAFEARKGSQIAVLIVPTTAGEDIAQFGIRVAERWKIGRKKIDDGVILLIAKDDRRLRLEVGYGLEGAIPDAIAKRVIAEIIKPYFRDEDYMGGIQAGVQQLMRLIEGEALPQPVPGRGAGDDAVFGLTVIAGVVAGWLLSLLMSRPAAATLAALGSGAVGTLLMGFGVLILFIAMFVFIGVASESSRRGGWSSGGGLGSRSGTIRGGSGGTWNGGGGVFGGGGASGSW